MQSRGHGSHQGDTTRLQSLQRKCLDGTEALPAVGGWTLGQHPSHGDSRVCLAVGLEVATLLHGMLLDGVV